MTDCFETIVGLSDRECDCFADGRPDAPTETTENRVSWAYKKFTSPDPGPDPYPSPWLITADYDLPAEDGFIQLFAGGQLLTKDADYAISGAREIQVFAPDPGQTYQLYYLATVPVTITTPAYSESKSGLFITDLLPEEEIAGLASCDQTLWALMQKARTVAIRDFVAAINTTLQRRYATKYKTFQGFVGEDKGQGRLESAKFYAGVRIRTAGIRSGYLKISRIMAMFQQSGTVTVTIYKGRVVNEETGEMELEVFQPAFAIATAANSRAITNTDINLPLLGDFSAEQDYLIAYEYDAANKPALNRLDCGCSNRWSPTLNVTTYAGKEKSEGGNRAWHNFFLIGGWEGDISGGTTTAPAEVTQYLNGLALEVEVGCDMSAGLCAMVQAYGSNPYGVSIATAIHRGAAAYLVRRRLSSSAPNRLNAVNRDAIEKELRTWQAEYSEIVTYLSENMPATSHDCLECRPQMRVGSILT